MPDQSYAWRGNNRQGQAIKGEIQAANKFEATQLLHKQRIRVTHIHRQITPPAWLTFRPNHRIKTSDITRLTRQLATLLRAGVPLLQAFDILHRSETMPTTQTVIHDIYTQIETGTALHKALQRHAVFDSLYCNMVAVGELSGMLDTMLERLAHHLEKSEALHATVRSALIYPAAVLLIASSVLILILIFVVPAFQNIFASFGAELPWLTHLVIEMSEWMQQYGLVGLLIALGTTAWIKHRLRQNAHWQKQLHSLLLRLPIAGQLARHTYTAQWTRTLATLFAAGIPLTDALTSVQGITRNVLFQAATQSIQSELMQGISLSIALQSKGNLFPPMVIQMCAIGEESGALEHMLEKTAEHYEREVDQTVTRLSTLLEPVIMVVLGLLIGGLVMALYLPIFQLGQVV